MPNRLINETSPYLLQHAYNPVDWFPWGSEALQHAQSQDKPILLSVGYSACHWCHVMERESFENPHIAGIMNDNFINIKVDREERPDIDSIYMTAVQAISGHGGWPMTVFLTPDAKPFYGGTYFPPQDRGGIPAFPRVLTTIAEAYQQKRADILQTTEQLLQRMRHLSTVGSSNTTHQPLTADILSTAARRIASDFDPAHGGIGMQPKFPQPMTYEFLLRHHLRTQDPDSLHMADLTLERMAHGGIYDQLGGGFHRYSTDAFWLVPHFEKMLYDNALLARLYLHAYQITGKPLYKRIVEETLDYVLREMTSPEGGFYSAQDADSEGVEGKFFIWTPQQITQALGEQHAALINRLYGVTPHGNFEGRSILHIAIHPQTLAQDEGLDAASFSHILNSAKQTLLDIRSQRIAPNLDDKILTSWNGLTLIAFAEAAAVLRRSDYTHAAIRSAEFLTSKLIHDYRLLRTYKNGEAKLNAYLEDYACLIQGLLSLHELTFNPEWLQHAITLGEGLVDLFWDESSNQFFDTGADHEALIVRPKDITDNAIPCGSSMAADTLLKLAVITDNHRYEQIAATALRSMRDLMIQFPSAAGHWLGALDFHLSTTKEIVIVGDRTHPQTHALTDEVYRHYIPNRVMLGIPGNSTPLQRLPLLADRPPLNSQPTAYVCQNYTCQLPVNSPQDLANQLV